jgi:streptomycin 6-kinase
MSGDPHYEPAPMLWNRWDEVQGAVREGVRRRFHTLVDVAGLDEDRARDWVVVRMMHNALWRLQDEAGTPGQTRSDGYLTMCVAIAKAVQE